MEVTGEEKLKLEKIGKKYDLRFIVLHGSYAKGTPRPGSDLDIAIVGKDRIGLDEFLDIHGELSDIFGDSPERELDLKTLQGADPLFRYQVTRDGILLYGNRTEFNEFKSYAYRAYTDSYDLRNLQGALLRKSIREIRVKL